MSQPTEFKSLDEMTEAEIALERRQIWMIIKSSSAWWIHRNHAAFMPCQSEERARQILEDYGITVYGVDRSQKEVTAADWARYRRDKPYALAGRGPSLGRRFLWWLRGDAA